MLSLSHTGYKGCCLVGSLLSVLNRPFISSKLSHVCWEDFFGVTGVEDVGLHKQFERQFDGDDEADFAATQGHGEHSGADTVRLGMIKLAGLRETLDDSVAECKDLVDRVTLLTDGILKKKSDGKATGAQEDDELIQLARVVDDISSWTEEIQNAKPLRKALDAAKHSNRLTHYNKLLDDIYSRLHLDVTLDIRKILKDSNISRDTPPSLVIPADLPLVELPPDPAFVKGRDEQRKYVREELLRSPSKPIAVLAGGGMGKTTFAVMLLHDEAVVAEFGRNRVFVGCDGVTTADGIVSDMLTLLHMRPPEGVTPLQALVARLHSLMPRAFVVLDNLESSWDTSQQEEVETLLTSLCNIPTLALMITMRGAKTPRGQRWLSFDPLRKLSPEEARSLFMDISGTSDDKLNELLGHLDGLPLAVTLMAELGKNTTGDTPSSLLRSYLTQKTSMVDTGGKTRTSSLGLSIMVSLQSRTMQENPEALEMLRPLCLLPDGVHDVDLESIFPQMKQLDAAIRILRTVALATYTDKVTRVLVPIRDFMLANYPPSGVHMVAIQKYYMQLACSGYDYPDISQALVQTLSSQMANLQSVLMHALAAPLAPSNRLVLLKAINSVSWFSYHTYIGDWTDILRIVISEPLIHAGSGQAINQASLNSGNYIHRRFLPLLNTLRLRQSRKPSDSSQRDLRMELARSAWQLGTTLTFRYQHLEAAKFVNEAKAVYTDLKHRPGVAACLRGLGDVLRTHCDYDQATDLLNEARDTYGDLGNQSGVAGCLWSLGEILRQQGEYDRAAALLNEAKAAYTDLGDRGGVAGCIWSLGDILRRQGDYDQAADLFNEAIRMDTDIGNGHDLAVSTLALAQTRQTQGKLDEASALFTEARTLYEESNRPEDAKWCEERLHELSELRAQRERDQAGQTDKSQSG